MAAKRWQLITQAALQVGIPVHDAIIVNSHVEGLRGAYNDDEVTRPGDRRIEEIALQEQVVLGQQRQHDRRVLATLRLVHRYRVRQDKLTQLAELVSDGTAVEIDEEDDDRPPTQEELLDEAMQKLQPYCVV